MRVGEEAVKMKKKDAKKEKGTKTSSNLIC